MSLESLLAPRSVAIAGVSSAAGGFQVGGRAVLAHLLAHGFDGRLHLVTRRGEPVEGIPAARSVAGLPRVPDCLVVAVPAADVETTVREGLALGVRAFVVISSGFAEAGADGGERQRRLASLLREAGACMLGPNTTGFVNFHRRIAASSTSRLAGALPRAGAVGLVIQSGALGSGFLDQAAAEGIGLSHLVSTGNQAVTGLADCVAYLAADPATRVIALYVEAFQDFGAFIGAARAARAAGKPVAVYKAGRHESGRLAAAGHTGALVGAHDAWRAAARQLDLHAVEHVEDLLPAAAWLAQPQPAGAGVAVLTLSGGLGGALADALGDAGARLPAPSAPTVARLREHLPAFQSVDNPVDCAGAPFRREGGFAACLDALVDDPAYDAVVVASTPVVAPWADAMVAALSGARKAKPVAVLWHGEVFNAPALAALRDGGVTVFRRVSTLATALAAGLPRTPGDSRLLDEGERWRGAAADGAGVALDEACSRERLRALGLDPGESRFVARDMQPALAGSAAAVGFPVTLKGVAGGLVHKTEHGLVAVGLADPAALARAAQDMLGRAGAHGIALRGFLLMPTVRFEAEVLASVALDPEFGPVLTVGAGGIHAEMLRDVATGLLPMSRAEIARLLDGCRVAALLHGARGRPPLDVSALLDRLEALAALGARLGPDLRGVELNPVAVSREGAWILDACVLVARRPVRSR